MLLSQILLLMLDNLFFVKVFSTPDPEKLLNCQKHVSPKFFNYHKYLEASFKNKRSPR